MIPIFQSFFYKSKSEKCGVQMYSPAFSLIPSKKCIQLPLKVNYLINKVHLYNSVSIWRPQSCNKE